MPRIHVLRPFVYSTKPAPGHKLPTERHFSRGHHEIAEGDPMLSDPWVTKHFADGAIETPAAAAERAKKLAAKAATDAEEGLRAQASADAAFARAGASNPAAKVNYEEHQKALNTPVNQLKGASGTSIDEVSPDQARASAEATPTRPTEESADGEESSDAGESDPEGAPAGRRRGRPPGSRTRPA